MTLTLLIAGGAGLLAVVVVAVVVRSNVRPVRLLSEAVQHVVETRDFQPVSVPHANGQVATLASWFNRLLRMVARMRERQNRLVLDAGHELRNPLTSLRTNVDLLAVDLRSDRLSAAQRAEIMGDIQAQLGELSGLVTDLTHLARDEDEAEPEALDVSQLVEAAVDRVRRRGQDRLIDVELQPLFMMGHADSLSRAVVNLLDNALKWTPSGGTVQVRLEGNRLRVSDEGPGIPEADLPYVFDRFFRGQTGSGTPGTGLGLSIVAKIVEDHGGSVRAGRTASGGAEFVVQLPGATSLEALSDVPRRTAAERDAARWVEAAAVEAAVVAEEAVSMAADEAAAVAFAARQARAAATARTASAMAETVKDQALADQEHADAAARQVAEAAATAAAKVASAVLPGHEVEAQEAAAAVAQLTVEAAAAAALQTARVAAASARAAAAAALKAATAAADAAMLVELEVHGAALAIHDAAEAAAARAAEETRNAAKLVNIR
jgi:signal transduction histidine kinase